MNDNLIADCLTRIRNGVMSSLLKVRVVRSKLIIGILECLLKEGYIKSYSMVEDNYILIELKYSAGYSAIETIDLVSKPSKRIYSSIADLKPFRNGLGTIILSTNRGVMTDHRARIDNVGGEVLCRIF